MTLTRHAYSRRLSEGSRKLRSGKFLTSSGTLPLLSVRELELTAPSPKRQPQRVQRERDRDHVGVVATTDLAAALSDSTGDDNVIEDVEHGRPVDGLWDYNDAIDERFCFEHGEKEYLLQIPDRWMRACDFAEQPRLGKILESRWNNYQLQPHVSRRPARAECQGTLWSHADAVMNRKECNGEVFYRIRWKLCWTLSSDVGDSEWPRKCLERHRGQKRCSSRLRQTAGFRAQMNALVMKVVRIE